MSDRRSIFFQARKIAALVAAVLLPVATLMAPSAVYADGGPVAVNPGNIFDVLNVNNIIEEFTIGGNNGCTVYHRWGSAPFTSPTGQWYSLGGCVLHGFNPNNGKDYGLDVGRNQDGRLEVFAIGTNHAVWHTWQTRAASGPWSGWYSMGGYATGGPSVRSMWPGCQQVNGCFPRMLVTVTGGDNRPWVNQQTTPNCCWSGWHRP